MMGGGIRGVLRGVGCGVGGVGGVSIWGGGRGGAWFGGVVGHHEGRLGSGVGVVVVRFVVVEEVLLCVVALFNNVASSL